MEVFSVLRGFLQHCHNLTLIFFPEEKNNKFHSKSSSYILKDSSEKVYLWIVEKLWLLGLYISTISGLPPVLFGLGNIAPTFYLHSNSTGIVTRRSKVMFSGRSTAFSSLSQRSRFWLLKNFISLIWIRNNALSAQASRFQESRVSERLFSIRKCRPLVKLSWVVALENSSSILVLIKSWSIWL